MSAALPQSTGTVVALGLALALFVGCDSQGSMYEDGGNADGGLSDGVPAADARVPAVCRGVTCSGQGRCVGEDAPACECDDGHHAEGLMCIADDCLPTAHAASGCADGDLYWYDGCGAREDLKASCGGLGCSLDACTPREGLAPVLSGFRIEPAYSDRVLFASSQPIRGNLDDGFVISGKEIAEVTIQEGALDGHFFTVTEPFTFWDNQTIRYEGGSDFVGTGGVPLHDFVLRYVENGIQAPTPTASAHFVRTTGDDSNNGLTHESAFRTLARAISEEAGVIYVQSGDYGPASVSLPYGGTAEQPLLIQGYQTVSGGVPDPVVPNYWTWGDYGTLDTIHVDTDELPTLSGTNRTEGNGLSVREYTIVRNFQVTGFKHGIAGSGHHVIIDNAVVVSVGDTNCTGGVGLYFPFFQGQGQFRNITISDVGSGAMVWHKGSFSLFTDIRMYQDAGNGDACAHPDYYLSLYGNSTTGGSNNIVRNVLADRMGDLGGSAHGLSLKSWDRDLEYNLIENSTAINMVQGVELRHDHVRYNVVRNVESYARDTDGDANSGIVIRDNANFNTIENCSLHGLNRGIYFYDQGGEQGLQPPGHDNLFRNITVRDCEIFVGVAGTEPTGTPPFNNRFLNFTVDNVTYFSATYWGMPDNNVIANSTFSNIAEWERLASKPDPEFTYRNSNFWTNGSTFSTPGGSGITEQEPGFIDGESGNFRLQASSPLRDAGGDLPDNRYDFEGNERMSGAYSVGAYEVD